MKFNEQVNAYIEELNCTAKELADAAGLSAAVISRYRTGEREPGQESIVAQLSRQKSKIFIMN